MRKFKNSKGFTLIELLVVIVIIGIITVLALPGVQQLQARNRNKKYETYSNTLESAGKLYTDSYSDDMFGMTGSGCFDIPYSELKGKSLIKNYESDGVTCDDPDTFVQVKREGEKYTYAVSLKCTKDGAVVYENVLSTCNSQSLTASDVPIILVEVENQGGYDGWSTSKDFTIKIVSKDGLKDNASISYGWTTDPTVMPTSMQTKYFRNDTGVYELSTSFTESGRNGIWHLVIDGDNLIDVGGRYAADKVVENLKFDNTAPETPTLNNPYDNVWVGDAIVSANLYVIGVSSLDSPSGIREYQYRFPNSTNEWVPYASSSGNSFTTTPFKTAREEIVEIRACDFSGLCSSPASSMIKIDRSVPSCTVNLSGTTGSNGWYKGSDVTVSLSTNDSGGSIVSEYGLSTSTSVTYNSATSNTQGNTAGVTWYGYVKDTAGNTATCNSGSFKVDTVVPTCSVELSGTVGDNGWYKANNVSVSLTKNDTGGSTLAGYDLTKSSTATYAGTTSSSQGNTTGVTWYGYVKDKAGNVASCSKNFKVDKSSPTCAIKLAGNSANGYYSSTVAVSFNSKTDTGGSNLSAFGLTTSATATYNNVSSATQGETSGVRYYGYVKDGAGNVGSCNSGSFKVKLRTIPEFTYTGSYEIVDDSDNKITDPDSWSGNWKIRFLTSGTLTFTNLHSAANGIDVFLVGGGGNGGSTYSGQAGRNGYSSAGGGGGGGYRTTKKGVSVSTTTYTISVGAARTKSTAFGYTANPGSNGTSATGFDQWSAGGAGGSSGGSGGCNLNNGSAGAAGGCEFNDCNFSSNRYGGGGGGGHGHNGYVSWANNSQLSGVGRAGSGGAGGGATGNNQYRGYTTHNGQANTGGGGGGASFVFDKWDACGTVSDSACSCWSSNGCFNVSRTTKYSAGTGGSGIVIIRNKR